MAKNKTVNQASYLVLNKALAAFRVDYRARYVAFYTSSLKDLQAALKANGMDLNKVAPYPSSINLNVREYRQALVYYKWSHSVVKHAKSSLRCSEPDIVEIKQDAWEKETKRAEMDADLSIDSYIFKLIHKIEDVDINAGVIEKATYFGQLWSGSELEVDVQNGARQVWYTKCIINRSCLGTVFNQWPTRRIS